MSDIDELIAAIADVAGVVESLGRDFHVLNGAVAHLTIAQKGVQDRLTLLEKNWE